MFDEVTKRIFLLLLLTELYQFDLVKVENRRSRRKSVDHLCCWTEIAKSPQVECSIKKSLDFLTI